jgi:protein-S-isoprenylcysteine O-methyltransferase Ste14
MSILLFLVFFIFHSACAQTGFKDWLGRLLSPFFVTYFWRLIYVFISLKLYFGIAAPYLTTHLQNVVLFNLDQTWMSILQYIRTIGHYSFILVLVEIDFLYYFGLKQATAGLLILFRLKKETKDPIKYTLKTKYFYGVVRHPLYFSLILMLLPSLTNATGLIMFLLIVVYLLIGLPIEERKLIRQFGEEYIEYRKCTPSFIPFTKLAWFKRFKYG